MILIYHFLERNYIGCSVTIMSNALMPSIRLLQERTTRGASTSAQFVSRLLLLFNIIFGRSPTKFDPRETLHILLS